MIYLIIVFIFILPKKYLDNKKDLMIFSFISSSNSVDMAVMDEGMVSISPGECLGTSPHVVILFKLCTQGYTSNISAKIIKQIVERYGIYIS